MLFMVYALDWQYLFFEFPSFSLYILNSQYSPYLCPPKGTALSLPVFLNRWGQQKERR